MGVELKQLIFDAFENNLKYIDNNGKEVNPLNDSRALVQGVPIPLMKQDVSGTVTPLLADITKIMQEFSLGTMPLPGEAPVSPASGYDTQMTGSNMDVPVGDRTIGGATFFSNHHFIETNR